MSYINFQQEDEVFTVNHPDNYTYLYFPVAGEQGILSSITPILGGDSKLDQNAFLLEPVSSENLHNNKSTRNFWCQVENVGAWSAAGASAEAEMEKYTQCQDACRITAGFMWQTVTRKTSKYHLESNITSFVPLSHCVEIMRVTIENTSESEQSIVPVAAVPVYGRSADNIRDHRHVTSLLHQISTVEYGIEVKPKLSFDERGHQENHITYFVYGISGDGSAPERFFPTVEEFIGEGGSLTAPLAVKCNKEGIKAGTHIEGKEAMAGLKFKRVTLQPNQKKSYTILIGASKTAADMLETVKSFNSDDKVCQAFEDMKKYWKQKVNVSFYTGNAAESSYLRWICFQPILRRIYGCSFLPHHDYGKGGRGWRDLWQDCLSLLFMNPEGVRQMIVDNYEGVRVDGTNATIIGNKPGEFKADRNSITRVWMDHGFWPFLTTKLYIDQTGDIEIFEERVPYFKDGQICRGTGFDENWGTAYGMRQRDDKDGVYRGSIFEHILLQQLCAFYEVGEHNHIRLRNADWNDALDMAAERGESVAFTSAYAYNLKELAEYLKQYGSITKRDSVELLAETAILLANERESYNSAEWKHSILQKYVEACRHNISGRMVSVPIAELTQNLLDKAEWMAEHIRNTEWVTDKEGNGWFNGYYDNRGKQVEGMHGGNVRMMLTSQVFSIMSGTAGAELTEKICTSADKYLYKENVGGYCLNTRFDEDKFDLGRMFGFAYGEKENGAVFSHMTVMFANALYKQGFVKEGYKVLHTLLKAAMNFEASKIYPGIPEYFDANGRGMYHYLTGAASWYMLTMITEVYGVKGSIGDLVIAPKLMAGQFDENGYASIRLEFMKKKFLIQYSNPGRLSYEKYQIAAAVCDDTIKLKKGSKGLYLDRKIIEGLDDTLHKIRVELAEK